MSNPENFFKNTGEGSGNESRELYQNRGEMTKKAEEWAEDMKRLEALRARLAEIEASEPAPEPTPAPEPILTPIPEENPESQTDPEKRQSKIAEIKKKAQKSKAFKVVLAATVVIAIASAVGFGIHHHAQNSSAATEQPPVVSTEAVADIGEKEELSLQYDYTEWSDFEHKSSHNAYGTNYSDCFGNDEKTTAGFLKKAEDMPEALASYQSMFFEDEQKELGISGMSDRELEEYMSDVDSPESAAMQKKLLDKMAGILSDTENTKWEYNYENETENSHYIIWEDENSDGIQTPDEMHLGYSTVARHNAPQANLYRRNQNGDWVKVLDLNLYCGFQPNTPLGKTPSVPFIEEEEPEVIKNITPAPEVITEDITTPETTPDDTPTHHDPTPDTPIVPETPAPKDSENLTRIDENIEKNIEQDIHTENLVITPTEDVTKIEEITEQPNVEEFHIPSPIIIKNEKAEEAEPIQGEVETGMPSQISPENDYSVDLGGANDQNAAENPVEADHEAQVAADAAEIPIEEAPGVDDIGSTELDDILSELGIR